MEKIKLALDDEYSRDDDRHVPESEREPQVRRVVCELRAAVQEQAEVASLLVERLRPVCRPIRDRDAEGVEQSASRDRDVVPLAQELIDSAEMIRGNTRLLTGALGSLEI
jgi:hypothetical protein